MIRLGVNLDHIATVRQARGEKYPDPVQAALIAEIGGADNITCHLREDRRHIQDRDVELFRQTVGVPLNLEIAATDEMIKIACAVKPDTVTLVPEKRQELTTEGGLDLGSEQLRILKGRVDELHAEGIFVSFFVEPDAVSVEFTKECGADAVEFHTGEFCRQIDAAVSMKDKWALIPPLKKVSKMAYDAELEVHFGHGLHYENARWLQCIEECSEANIGHSIVARSMWVGLERAVAEMKNQLNDVKYKPKSL